MKTIIVLGVLVATCQTVPTTDFSVHVKGKLLCREEPVARTPVDILSDDELFNYNNFLTRWTNDSGEFSITAWQSTDQFMITPYVVINHRCWERKELPRRCDRKIIQPIPPINVTIGSQIPDEKKVFDIGTIDLRFKHPAEVVVRCGRFPLL